LKYGGTYVGERKLSSKLAKKYGSRVKLLLAEQTQKKHEESTTPRFDESWYEVPQKRSGVINFSSDQFDAVTLLNSSEAKVRDRNSCFDDHSITCLDNTHQFAKFLPLGDPLHCHTKSAKRATNGKQTVAKRIPKTKSSHPFAQIADSFQLGPAAMLRNLQQQRVCVITRYVNAIRGSLTGTLIAFDKHLNMVLLDVEETYTCRPLERGMMTNVQVEVERRRNLLESQSPGISTFVKRRRMKQIMLRGDCVVSVYKEPEREL